MPSSFEVLGIKRPAKRHLVIGDHDDEPECGMEFRLTYAGPVMSRRFPGADHKQEIRKVFHAQLKNWWQVNPYLKHGMPVEFGYDTSANPAYHVAKSHQIPLVDWVANNFPMGQYRFVPLVRKDLGLLCSIDILFMRPGHPGGIIRPSRGDLDNRVKTVIDALRKPENMSELGVYSAPQVGEDPFFCLLEDDSLITRLTVETDVLLEPVSPIPKHSDARLLITVRLRPYNSNPANADFA